MNQPRLIPDAVTLLRPRSSDCSVAGCGSSAVAAVEYRQENRAVCQVHGDWLTEIGWRWVRRRD